MANAPKQTLSKASPYEQLFKTRYRGSGRPTADDLDLEPVFPVGNNHPAIAGIAKRRALAVVHEQEKDRLRELFHAELKVLNRRDEAEVLADARIRVQTLADIEDEEEEED
jgi:hypothetical protein